MKQKKTKIESLKLACKTKTRIPIAKENRKQQKPFQIFTHTHQPRAEQSCLKLVETSCQKPYTRKVHQITYR